jgi:hypothetical protein
MLVVMEMKKPGAGDGSETPRNLMVGRALKLYRAHETLAVRRGEPTLDEAKQPLRITNNVREQPIYPSDTRWIESEGAFLPDFYPG